MVCLPCGAFTLVFKMAFMALIDPLILLLVRCDCSCADLPDSGSVVMPVCAQFSACVRLFSFKLKQIYIGALLIGHRLRPQWSDR